MIYYNESPPWGMFNKFINDYCLEKVADYIISQMPGQKWELPSIPVEMAFISLDQTRSLSVIGDTLLFCCTFVCGFFPRAGMNDIDEADSTALDVVGRILFHPPGSKKYELTFTGIHVNNQLSGESEKYHPNFPGVHVSQMLHPAFGANETYRREKLEKEADRFLRQYYPEALETLCPVPLREIAEEKMGLRVFTGYKLPDQTDALGLTVFQTRQITVTDEETGEKENKRFPRGSVIIDADTIWARGFGSFNFTLAHEIYHWYAHRVHLAFMDIMGRTDDYDTIKGHLESQANGVGARIIMPRDAIRKKYAEAVERLGDDGVDAYEMAVSECAAFFGTSKTAIKIRLSELDIHEMKRQPTIRRRLDIVELFTIYATDQDFRNLLESGVYRYAKGYVVKNDPKYITDEGLTEYAREHSAECVMTFRESNRSDAATEGDLLFRKDAYFSLTADYDMRMKDDPVGMERRRKKLTAMKEAYTNNLDEPMTVSRFIFPIIWKIDTKYMGLDILDDVDDGLDAGQLVTTPGKRYSSRYFKKLDFQTGKMLKITEAEVFQDKTLIGYKTFNLIRRDAWPGAELDSIIAVCAGYHLDMETTEKALMYGGYLLLWSKPRHVVFRFLISHCQDEYSDTDTFNTLLKLLGEEPVGTNKRKDKE